jgi:hypothetical protein
MAAVVNAQTVGAGFNNQVEYARVTYDFSVDGGATGALDLMTAGAGGIVIVDARLVVKTACTSGGSATIKWGPSADDDRFCNTTQGAVASLTAGAVIVPPALEGTPNVIACPFYLAAAAKLIMTIGTAALTAGKVEFVIGYVKA